MPTHDYSPEWYAIFLDAIPATQTEAEVAFIARQLPLASHPWLLDVCCGPGRHANRLASRGYQVLGIDHNAEQIARASAQAATGASFHTYDIRDLSTLPGEFDGVVNLWASFGYFDDAMHQHIVQNIARRMRPGGRAIIDVYNREHMLALPAAETSEHAGVTVHTRRSWSGKRLRVVLTYGTGAGDDFEWRLYTPDELVELCSTAGLESLLACAWFTESMPASAEHARMQLVLEKR